MGYNEGFIKENKFPIKDPDPPAHLNGNRIKVCMIHKILNGNLGKGFKRILFSWNFPWRGNPITPSVENNYFFPYNFVKQSVENVFFSY